MIFKSAIRLRGTHESGRGVKEPLASPPLWVAGWYDPRTECVLSERTTPHPHGGHSYTVDSKQVLKPNIWYTFKLEIPLLYIHLCIYIYEELDK